MKADSVVMGSPIGPFLANIFQFQENHERKANLGNTEWNNTNWPS